MGKLIELNAQGDTTSLWDPTDEASVREMNEKFISLMERGFTLVERRPGEPTFHRATTFDPETEEVIAIFPMTGG